MSRSLAGFVRIMRQCGRAAPRGRLLESVVALLVAGTVAGGLVGVVPAEGQNGVVPADTTAAVATEGEGLGSPAAVDVQSAPPLEVATPQMERAYRHVFIAFGIVWALLLGYVVLLNRRLAAAERDLSRLREGEAAGGTGGG